MKLVYLAHPPVKGNKIRLNLVDGTNIIGTFLERVERSIHYRGSDKEVYSIALRWVASLDILQ